MSTPLTRDSLAYFFSKIVPAIAGLLFVTVLIRWLGPEQYGRLAMTMALANVLSALGGGWLNQAILRFESADTKSSDRVATWRTHFGEYLAALSFVGLGTLVLVIASQAHRSEMPGAGDASLSALLASTMVIYYAWLARSQARLRSWRVAGLEAFRGLLGLLLPCAAVLLTGTKAAYPAVILALSCSFIGPFLAAAMFGGGLGQPAVKIVHSSKIAVSDTWTVIRKHLAYGWPLSAWLGVMMMFAVVDRLALAAWSGYEAVGVYSSLYDLIVRGFGLVFAPIVLAAHPRIMQLADTGDSGDWARMLRQALWLQALIFVPLVAVIALSANLVLPLLLGTDIARHIGIDMVLALSLAAYIWQIALLVHKPLEVDRKPGRMLAFVCVALGIHVLGCWWLVPRFSGLGASLSYVLAGTVYVSLCFAAARRHYFHGR